MQRTERLREEVSHVLRDMNVRHSEQAVLDELADVEVPPIYVLNFLVMFRIVRESFSASVIRRHCCRRIGRET